MSSSTAQSSVSKRIYRLGKREKKQRETRQRIIEAAVELHSTIGPARTSVAQIAELAGVQRHTYYAHFPDERGLFLACSGLALERDPLPDVTLAESRSKGRERVRFGLEQFYGWFSRNEGQAGCVMRDAEIHPLTREMVDLRFGPVFSRAAEVLGEGLDGRSRAMLGVALDFACWRTLGRTYDVSEAADLMSDAVLKVGRR
jgi:AcrR family transcriptional regulator